ncbi:MAG: hypothetical protein ACI4ED_06270 [Suilimivivens sp.]
MIRQIRLLTQVSLCNLFGINEFRFTKDTKKKTRYYLMSVLWCFLIVLMAMYVCALSYGLCHMKMGDLLPAMLAMIVAVVVFLFTLFKAGSVLFDRRAYERQIALPVTVRAVIVSRFLTMYLTNMLLGFLVMLPGMAVYGVMERPGFSFYLYGLLGSLFLPLLPLTAASALGALIAGISSRWKRKNLVAIVLTMIFVCVIMIGSMSLSGMEETQLEEMLLHMAELFEAQIEGIYPPAIWLSKAMVLGKAGMLILFLAVSAGCFVLFLEILRPFYEKICALLCANEAQRNYQMKGLSARSVRRSMVERELRHYFSSTVYVTNTLVGEVLMVLLAIAVAVVGKESIENMVAIPGIVERVLPVMLGAMPALMPTTACSISMEGKQWWLMQTLPVKEKDILQSKVLSNLVVAAPFYLVSEVVLILALRPSFINILYLVIVPALYILFGAVSGVLINRKFPVFDWENETRVVKQSASTFLSMLLGIIVGMVPLAAIIYFR